MRGSYLTTALGVALALAGCDSGDRAAEPAKPPVVSMLTSDAIDVDGDRGTYVNGDGGGTVRIGFALPADRIDVNQYHDVERIGRAGAVVAVLDTYGSRAANGRCADGREAWLRLFSIGGARQLQAIPVISCLDGLRAGDPPVVWHGDGFEITGAVPRRFTIEGERIRPANGEKGA